MQGISLDEIEQHLKRNDQLAFWKNKNLVYEGCNTIYSQLLHLNHSSQIKGLNDRILNKNFQEIYLKDDKVVIEKGEVVPIHNPACYWALGNVTVEGALYPVLDRDNIVTGIFGLINVQNRLGKLPLVNALEELVNQPIRKLLKYPKYPININKKIVTLTKREAESILHLLIGRTQQEIAQHMDVSKKAVEQYLNNCKFKLKCYRRSDLLQTVLAGGFFRWI